MTTLTKTSIRRAVTRQDDKVNKLLKAYSRDVQGMFDGFLVRVENLLQKQKLSKTDLIDIREAITLADQMASLISDAGLSSLVEDFLDEFEPLTEDALRYFKGFKGFNTEDPLGGVDETHLDAWAKFSERNLRRSTDRHLIAPIQQSFLQSAFGGLPRSTIVRDIIQKGTTLRPDQVVVVVESSFRDYQREVTTLKAQELLGDNPIFQYTGPPSSDPTISEQCAFMIDYAPHGVPGMLYQDEITIDLHPKLRDNPLIHGGHPRCRHKWMPISLEYAIQEGFEQRNA